MVLILIYIVTVIIIIGMTYVTEHIFKKEREELINFKKYLKDMDDKKYEMYVLNINKQNKENDSI